MEKQRHVRWRARFKSALHVRVVRASRQKGHLMPPITKTKAQLKAEGYHRRTEGRFRVQIWERWVEGNPLDAIIWDSGTRNLWDFDPEDGDPNVEILSLRSTMREIIGHLPIAASEKRDLRAQLRLGSSERQ